MTDITNNQPSAPILSPQAIVQTMNESQEHAGGLSVLVNMSYQSLSGHFKDRDVLIRRVIHNKNEFYLDSLALDIKAPRLIKVAQVTSIRDVGTGYVYDDPYEFLKDKFGLDMSNGEKDVAKQPDTPQNMPMVTDFARVIQETGPEMTVLMYVVAIDGTRQAAERNIVFEYIKRRTAHLNYDEEDLSEYLISLAPDEDSCTLALQYVIEKGKTVVQEFLETMIEVISSDDVINVREKAFLARTIDILEEDGYSFSLQV